MQEGYASFDLLAGSCVEGIARFSCFGETGMSQQSLVDCWGFAERVGFVSDLEKLLSQNSRAKNTAITLVAGFLQPPGGEWRQTRHLHARAVPQPRRHQLPAELWDWNRTIVVQYMS